MSKLLHSPPGMKSWLNGAVLRLGLAAVEGALSAKRSRRCDLPAHVSARHASNTSLPFALTEPTNHLAILCNNAGRGRSGTLSTNWSRTAIEKHFATTIFGATLPNQCGLALRARAVASPTSVRLADEHAMAAPAPTQSDALANQHGPTTDISECLSRAGQQS